MLVNSFAKRVILVPAALLFLAANLAQAQNPPAGAHTALTSAAVSADDPALIHELLAAGENLSAKGESGFSALQWAAMANPNPEICAALLEAGADPEDGFVTRLFGGSDGSIGMESSDDRPLRLAIRHNPNPAVVTALIRGGANPEAPDHEGKTALYTALTERDDPAFLERILQAGADPNFVVGSLGHGHVLDERFEFREGTEYPLAVAVKEARSLAKLKLLLAFGAGVPEAAGFDALDESLAVAALGRALYGERLSRETWSGLSETDRVQILRILGGLARFVEIPGLGRSESLAEWSGIFEALIELGAAPGGLPGSPYPIYFEVSLVPGSAPTLELLERIRIRTGRLGGEIAWADLAEECLSIAADYNPDPEVAAFWRALGAGRADPP